MAIEKSAAWDEYFTGPVPPEGGVNWEAYSHDELYQMLWQDADVADVSMVATEWAQHRAALNTHAEVLREQRVALEDSWQGESATEAANRLDALAARVEKISELAAAGQQVAQDAADALATARAMMPPPTGSPAGPSVPSFSPSTFSPSTFMPSSFSPGTDFATMFNPMATATPTTSKATTPTTDMGTAFGAVGSGGFSFYFGAVGADQQKAQAVRAMQTYESNLVGSGQLIDQARSAIPLAGPMPSAGEPVVSPASHTAGVAWERFVGSGPTGGVGGGPGAVMGSVVGDPAAGHRVPAGPGARVGALAGMAGGPGMPGAHLAAESAAARMAGHGGMMPPVGAGRGGSSDDETHENQLPVIDHGLFSVEDPPGTAVIAQSMEVQP